MNNRRKHLFEENYIILSQIGIGAQGSILQAKKIMNNQVYAVKKVMTKDAEVLHNQIQVFKNCNKLFHPNIIHYYEMYINENNECIYTVMEYVNYQSLQSQLFKLTIFELKQVIYLLLEALCFCHQQGICHRDIKPDNILVTKEDQIQIKIIDFDVSKDFLKKEMWTCVGCVYYQAPEIFDGGNYNELIDLWPVGELPFNEDSISETIEAIVKEEVQFEPKFFKDNICKDLIKRLLNKNPLNRITAQKAMKHPWFYQNSSQEFKSDYGFSFDEVSNSLSRKQKNLSNSEKNVDFQEDIKSFGSSKIHIVKKPIFDSKKSKLLKFIDYSFTPNPYIFKEI